MVFNDVICVLYSVGIVLFFRLLVIIFFIVIS